jgi:hypothetical protein
MYGTHVGLGVSFTDVEDACLRIPETGKVPINKSLFFGLA